VSIGQLAGIKVVQSPFATQLVYEVQPRAIKKKRRGWKVVKSTKPAMYVMADVLGINGGKQTLMIHPELFAKLPKGAL
jgi:hypothetical protein